MTQAVEPLLRLGPLLRHVGETHATIWVQTTDRATVTITAGTRTASAPTFTAFGFHYALILLDGLTPGSVTDYTVQIDQTPVWPPADSPFPPSRIATLDRAKPTRLAFGSCRTSSTHDHEGNKRHGVDALRAYAAGLLRDDHDGWPDLLVFLGDQVYADEQMPPEMVDFMRGRRDVEQPPGTEVKDYVEYDQLYQRAWGDPIIRWALSTIPSTMIFDDHDVRDDWNTSWTWRREMEQTSWWAERIRSGLASYWVYQHAGNLAPDELAEDEIWQRIAAHDDSAPDDELDLTTVLDEFAARANAHPDSYRWSYTRNLGDSRLLVIDSRAARDLQPNSRSMLDDAEMAWLHQQLNVECRHLFIGTSLPVLLPPGLHDLEALDEAAAQGAYGRLGSRAAEALRQTLDLEHWAAFSEAFTEVMDSVMALARGDRVKPPEVIAFLSGDVHHSYLAEVTDPGQYGARSHIVQAVCSPMRNPMPRPVRVAMSLFARGLDRPMRLLSRRSRHVEAARYPWSVTKGPWFENSLAVVEVDGDQLRFRWWTGQVTDDDVDHPRSRLVADLKVWALTPSE